MRKVSSLLLLLLVVVVAACSGSSKSSSSTTTTTQSAAGKTADLALAKGSVLTNADAPTGFSGKPHEKSSDPPEPLKRDFANCLGVDATLFDTSGQRADGPDFANDNGDNISNYVEIDATKAEVDKGYATLTNPKINDCLAKFLAAVIKDSENSGDTAGIKVGEVTVDSFPVAGIGDRGLGFRITVPLSANGQSTTVYFDIAAVQRGRAVLTVEMSANGTPPSRDLERQLLTKMSNRLGATAP